MNGKETSQAVPIEGLANTAAAMLFRSMAAGMGFVAQAEAGDRPASIETAMRRHRACAGSPYLGIAM